MKTNTKHSTYDTVLTSAGKSKLSVTWFLVSLLTGAHILDFQYILVFFSVCQISSLQGTPFFFG